MLVVAGIGPDELHLRARDGDVEHPGVRGVGQVDAHDLSPLRVEREVGIARDEHDVAEATHCDVGHLGTAEGRDASLLDEDVVQRQQLLAVRRRPVVGVARNDEDVAVQAQLLAVVLADVRVVPVGAGIGHVHAIRERLPHRDRRLGVVRSVESVLEPKAVPVHGRLEVSVVRDVDSRRRPLRELQRRTRDRPVVGQHPHGRVADDLAHRGDLEADLVAVCELHELGSRRFRKAVGGVRKSTRLRSPLLCAHLRRLLLLTRPGSLPVPSEMASPRGGV